MILHQYILISGIGRHSQTLSDPLDEIVFHTVKSFPCYICGKKFTRNTKRRIHVLTHKGGKPYLCDICGARFRQSAHVERHLRTVHNVVKSTPKVEMSAYH